jgi:hypothetical protein
MTSSEIHAATFREITGVWQDRGEGAAGVVSFAKEAESVSREGASAIEDVRARDDLEPATKARLISKIEDETRPKIDDALNRVKLASRETVENERRRVIPTRNYSDPGAAAREREYEGLILSAEDPLAAYQAEVKRAAREGDDAGLSLLTSRWSEALLAGRVKPDVLHPVREAAFLEAVSILAERDDLPRERKQAAAVLVNTRGPLALDNVHLVAHFHAHSILEDAVRYGGAS